MLRAIGLFNRNVHELLSTYYQFDAPFIADHSAFTSAFGGHITDWNEIIHATVESHRHSTPAQIDVATASTERAHGIGVRDGLRSRTAGRPASRFGSAVSHHDARVRRPNAPERREEVVGDTRRRASGAPLRAGRLWAALGRHRADSAGRSQPALGAGSACSDEPAMTSGSAGAAAASGRGDDQVGELFAVAGLDVPLPTGAVGVRSAGSRSSGRSSTGCRRRQSSRGRPLPGGPRRP
jgi:hypothetical protein